jgi:hypothetical protein
LFNDDIAISISLKYLHMRNIKSGGTSGRRGETTFGLKGVISLAGLLCV